MKNELAFIPLTMNAGKNYIFWRTTFLVPGEKKFLEGKYHGICKFSDTSVKHFLSIDGEKKKGKYNPKWPFRPNCFGRQTLKNAL